MALRFYARYVHRNLQTMGYLSVADSLGLSSFTCEVVRNELRKKAIHGQVVIYGRSSHSSSSKLKLIGSLCAISY